MDAALFGVIKLKTKHIHETYDNLLQHPQSRKTN